MFARLVESTAKPGKREEVIAYVMENILPMVKQQKGFVGIIGHVSDTAPNESAGMAYWKTKEDADAFFGSAEYKKVMEGMQPLIAEIRVRTFTVRASSFSELAGG